VLNVLQVIPTLDRSGAEKQMVLLAAGLPRDRFRVEVAALTRLGPLEADLLGAGIPIHAIGKRHKLDVGALNRLTRLMKDRRYDVVQTWIFAANVYGRVAARRAKVPVVLTAEMAVDLWKGRGQFLIDRRLAGWTDRVIGNSRAVVDFYRDTVGIPADRLEVIHSGIADEEPPEVDPAAVRAELDLPTDAPLLLFAGRLYPQKRVLDLLKALDILQHVRPNLRTLIAGDGPLRAELEQFADAVELLKTRRVLFLGHRDDVPRLLAASDALVLPSEFEGLPNVVLEAMRFRKPVVATAAPGTTELVVDDQTGLLVPIGDSTGLAKILLQIVDDPGLRHRLGHAGRSRVEQEFRADAMVDRFASLYERLSQARRLRGGAG
jgi:glycosyltransferase involved in cell wall biosynthesis